jgi:hypothetical protein
VGGANDGFWPEQNRIFPLAEENLHQNLMAAWAAGGLLKYADFSIVDMGNGNGYVDPGESAKIVFTVRNIGLNAAQDIYFRLKSVDPLVFISRGESTFPASIPARSEAFTDTFSLAVDLKAPPGLQPQLELEVDYGGFVDRLLIRDLLIGTPQIAISDNAENGLSNWFTGQGWNTTDQHVFSPANAFTDSPSGYYLPNANNTFTLKTPLNLSEAAAAFLEFRTRWDIEKNFDAGLVEVSTDNVIWTALDGLYTVPGSGKGRQTFGKPVYDGAQVNWVKEVIDLSYVLGSPQVYLRFVLRSEDFLERDGWYIDDVSVKLFHDVVVGVEAAQTLPAHPFLAQNYPNPFNPITNIRFGIPKTQHVQLQIFNVRGQIVKELADGEFAPGDHVVLWDGFNQHGEEVSSGIYFYVLKTGDSKFIRKMLLAR